MIPVNIGDFKWDPNSQAIVVDYIPEDLDRANYQAKTKGFNTTIKQAERIAALFRQFGGNVTGVAALPKDLGQGEYIIPAVTLSKIDPNDAGYNLWIRTETLYNGHQHATILNVGEVRHQLATGESWAAIKSMVQNLYGGQGATATTLTDSEIEAMVPGLGDWLAATSRDLVTKAIQ